MTSPLVEVEGIMARQIFNQLLMIFRTGQYQTISCSTQLSVMSCKFTLAKKSTRSLTCTLLTIILKLSRRLNCMVLPSSVISSGDSQVDNILKKANQKMFMPRKLKAAGLNSQELLVVYKGYTRPLIEYAAPCGTQVLLNNRVDQVENIQKRVCKYILGRNYKSYTKSLATLTMKTLHAMTGVSIFAEILLARYLLLIDS